MPYDENLDTEQDLSLLDIFDIFWRGRLFIFLVTFVFGVVSIVMVLLMTPTFKATCKILNNQTGNVASVGGISELLGLSSRPSNTQLLLSLLTLDTVVDTVIDKLDDTLHLMEEVSPDERYKVRQKLANSIDTETETGGIISISCINKSSEDAALIANTFVDTVRDKMLEISLEDARQKRRFFEEQLNQSQQELSAAEDALMNYQQSVGLIAVETQTESLLSSITNLRNQIAAKNVEISSLKSYIRADNPRLKVAQSQLDAMTQELRRLEEERKTADTGLNASSGGDLVSSLGQLPELGAEYQRYARAVRFAMAKYEAMFRQYESARLSEVNDLSSIFVLEEAVPPVGKYGPRRTRIVVFSTMAGGMLSVFIVFVMAHIRALMQAREEEEY